MGATSMSVDTNHQFAEDRPCALARTPIPVVTHAAMPEMSTTVTAISPRFTHPNNNTGVKYRPMTAAGATAGRAMCLTSSLIVGDSEGSFTGMIPNGKHRFRQADWRTESAG